MKSDPQKHNTQNGLSVSRFGLVDQESYFWDKKKILIEVNKIICILFLLYVAICNEIKQWKKHFLLKTFRGCFFFCPVSYLYNCDALVMQMLPS